MTAPSITMMRKRLPYIISVQGLKKSGKTTVTEALIASLRFRGFSVGSMKFTHLPHLKIDSEGSDTDRQAGAGAEFIVARSPEEIVIMDRRPGKKSFKEIARLIPEDLQFIICEGLAAAEVSLYVLCLRSLDELEEAAKIRHIPLSRLAALSGPAASKLKDRAAYPMFDIMNTEEREALISLIIKKAGDPSPAGRPCGPLQKNPDWRPGR
ncbi:hypothetical protein ES703_14488 [subsurface metagenome]